MKLYLWRVVTVASVLALCGVALVIPRAKAQQVQVTDMQSAGAEEQGKAKAEQGLSLKTNRELKFATDEGTWISLDVSPNGKMIVFDLLGHIYTMPVTGGEAKQITSGQGFDSMPHFSPDGSKIVFISDRSGANNVWIGNIDGTHLVRLTNDQQSDFITPIWSRDGQSVIVAR
ncbi:MAG: TolB family protein, partial [Candidatus Acidiferrales bacterium]